VNAPAAQTGAESTAESVLRTRAHHCIRSVVKCVFIVQLVSRPFLLVRLAFCADFSNLQDTCEVISDGVLCTNSKRSTDTHCFERMYQPRYISSIYRRNGTDMSAQILNVGMRAARIPLAHQPKYIAQNVCIFTAALKATNNTDSD
jgi:hypothetical protein